MDQESNQMQQHPGPCRNGCGFYSNAGTDGLCSVCYKDVIKKKQQPPTAMPASLAPAPGAMASLSIDESSLQSNSGNTSPTTVKTSSLLETASPTVVLPSQSDKSADTKESSEVCTEGSEPSPSSSEAGAPSTVPAIADSEQGGNKDGKKKKNRCLTCKKKVGLTGFECRCGGLFCSLHRYSDKHDCNFDYKELGAEEIRKSNPVIVAKKVTKI